MVVPFDKEGYTLYAVNTSEITNRTSKLLFQHKAKKYYYLFDRLLSYSSELRELVELIKNISMSWFARFKGRVITSIMRELVVYAATPNRYGNFGDYIMAAGYTQLRFYFQRLIKVLIKKYGLYPKKYKFEIKKKDLFYISSVFAGKMLNECVEMVPKYERLMSEQKSGDKLRARVEYSK